MAHTTTHVEFGFADSLRTAFSNLRAAAAQRAAYYRTYSELSRLTDRELADIGLRRCDIADVCTKAAHG